MVRMFASSSWKRNLKYKAKFCFGIWVKFCQPHIVLPSFTHGQQDSLFCSHQMNSVFLPVVFFACCIAIARSHQYTWSNSALQCVPMAGIKGSWDGCFDWMCNNEFNWVYPSHTWPSLSPIWQHITLGLCNTLPVCLAPSSNTSWRLHQVWNICFPLRERK